MNYIYAFHRRSSLSCSVLGTPRGARERDKKTSVLKQFAVQLGDRITKDRSLGGLHCRRTWSLRGEGSQELGCCLCSARLLGLHFLNLPRELFDMASCVFLAASLQDLIQKRYHYICSGSKHSFSQARKITEPTLKAQTTSKCTDSAYVSSKQRRNMMSQDGDGKSHPCPFWAAYLIPSSLEDGKMKEEYSGQNHRRESGKGIGERV